MSKFKRIPRYVNNDYNINSSKASDIISKVITGTYIDIKTSIFEYGSYLDIVDSSNRTITHALLENVNLTESETLALLKRLIELGAPIDIPDNLSGKRPLHLAAKRQFHSVIDLLTSKGAEPSSRDHALLTPLHYAISPTMEPCTSNTPEPTATTSKKYDDETKELCKYVHDMFINDSNIREYMKYLYEIPIYLVLQNETKTQIRDVVNKELTELIKKSEDKTTLINKKLVDSHFDLLRSTIDNILKKEFVFALDKDNVNIRVDDVKIFKDNFKKMKTNNKMKINIEDIEPIKTLSEIEFDKLKKNVISNMNGLNYEFDKEFSKSVHLFLKEIKYHNQNLEIMRFYNNDNDIEEYGMYIGNKIKIDTNGDIDVVKYIDDISDTNKNIAKDYFKNISGGTYNYIRLYNDIDKNIKELNDKKEKLLPIEVDKNPFIYDINESKIDVVEHYIDVHNIFIEFVYNFFELNAGIFDAQKLNSHKNSENEDIISNQTNIVRNNVNIHVELKEEINKRKKKKYKPNKSYKITEIEIEISDTETKIIYEGYRTDNPNIVFYLDDEGNLYKLSDGASSSSSTTPKYEAIKYDNKDIQVSMSGGSTPGTSSGPGTGTGLPSSSTTAVPAVPSVTPAGSSGSPPVPTPATPTTPGSSGTPPTATPAGSSGTPPTAIPAGSGSSGSSPSGTPPAPASSSPSGPPAATPAGSSSSGSSGTPPTIKSNTYLYFELVDLPFIKNNENKYKISNRVDPIIKDSNIEKLNSKIIDIINDLSDNHKNIIKTIQNMLKLELFDSIKQFNELFKTHKLNVNLTKFDAIAVTESFVPLPSYDVLYNISDEILEKYKYDEDNIYYSEYNSTKSIHEFKYPRLAQNIYYHVHVIKFRIIEHVLNELKIKKDNGDETIKNFIGRITDTISNKDEYFYVMVADISHSIILKSLERYISNATNNTLQIMINNPAYFNDDSNKLDDAQLIAEPDCMIDFNNVDDVSIYKYDLQTKSKNDDDLIERLEMLDTDKRNNVNYCYTIDGKTIRSLLNAGAEVNAIDKSRKTPMDYAFDVQSNVAIELLSEYGAKHDPQSVKSLIKQFNGTLTVSPIMRINDMISAVEEKIATDFNIQRVPIKGSTAISMTLYLLNQHLTEYMNTYPNMWTTDMSAHLLKFTGNNEYYNSEIPIVKFYKDNDIKYENAELESKKNKYETMIESIKNSIDNINREISSGDNENYDNETINELENLRAELEDNLVINENKLNNINKVLNTKYKNLFGTNNNNKSKRVYASNSRIRLMDRYDDLYNDIVVHFIDDENNYEYAIKKGIQYHEMWKEYLSKENKEDPTQVLNNLYKIIDKNNEVLLNKDNMYIITQVYDKVYGKYVDDLLNMSQFLNDDNLKLNDMFRILEHVTLHTITFDFINMTLGTITKNMNNNSTDFVNILFSEAMVTGFVKHCNNVLNTNVVKSISKIRETDDNSLDINTMINDAISMFTSNTSIQLNSKTLEALRGDLPKYATNYYKIYLTELYAIINEQTKLLVEQNKIVKLLNGLKL